MKRRFVKRKRSKKGRRRPWKRENRQRLHNKPSTKCRAANLNSEELFTLINFSVIPLFVVVKGLLLDQKGFS